MKMARRLAPACMARRGNAHLSFAFLPGEPATSKGQTHEQH